MCARRRVGYVVTVAVAVLLLLTACGTDSGPWGRRDAVTSRLNGELAMAERAGDWTDAGRKARALIDYCHAIADQARPELQEYRRTWLRCDRVDVAIGPPPAQP